MKSVEQISKEDQWWADANQYAKSIGHVLFEKELFLEVYYADGYSPEEVVREDWSYLQ